MIASKTFLYVIERWNELLNVFGQFFFKTGIINTILSWKGFVPLSRLTFLAYLWHGTIIWVYLGNLEGGLETNHMVIVSVSFLNFLHSVNQCRLTIVYLLGLDVLWSRVRNVCLVIRVLLSVWGAFQSAREDSVGTIRGACAAHDG